MSRRKKLGPVENDTGHDIDVESGGRAIRSAARHKLAKLTYTALRRRQGIVKSYFYLRRACARAGSGAGDLALVAQSDLCRSRANEREKQISLSSRCDLENLFSCYT